MAPSTGRQLRRQKLFFLLFFLDPRTIIDVCLASISISAVHYVSVVRGSPVMKQYLDAAEKAARTAGELLRRNFQQPLRVSSAEAHDIKLEIDVEVQELITKLLLKEFPEHALYGEEGIVGDQSSKHQWIVDPLDGTVNYFYGIPHFCVSIALRLRSEIMVGVIYDPIREEMWAGQKGERPKLNGHHFHVSDRADLADAIVSVGLSKTG